MLLSNRPSDRTQILHACADRDEIDSAKKNWTHPIPIETRSYRRPSAVRRSSGLSNQVCASVASLRSLNFAFGGNVTLSTSTHRHYDESVYRIKQLTRGNNTIGILMTSYCAFQTRQRPVARYVLFTSRAVHVGK